MRYVKNGKYNDIVNKEMEKLRCNSDTGLWVFVNDEGEYVEDYWQDREKLELYEEILWKTAELNVSKKYKIKNK